MKKILFAVLLSASSCVSQEKENETRYNEAVGIAEKQNGDEKNLGFGSQSGMTKAQVERHLNEKVSKGENIVKLSAYSRLTAEIEPQYASAKLTGIYVLLKGKETILDDNYKTRTKRRYTELVQMLNTRYRKRNYPHKSLDDEAISWFNGPIEIEAQYNEFYGIRMSYRDLHHYDQYLKEFVEQSKRKEETERARRSKEAERL